MTSRSAGGTCGTGRVSIDRITTCSLSAWRCSTLARMASGAVTLLRFRNTAVPGTRGDRVLALVQLVDERAQRALLVLAALGDDRSAALPGGEDREHGDADQQRQPRPVRELREVRGQEQQVDGEQAAAAEQHQPQRLPPLVADDVEEQQRRDRDRAGDRHAERERERDRALEGEDEREHGDHQHPVDPRHVDLPDRLGRGVRDPQPRQVAELDRLVGDREGAGDDRLRRDDGGRGGEEDQRPLAPVGHQQEERAGDVAPGRRGSARPGPCS